MACKRSPVRARLAPLTLLRTLPAVRLEADLGEDRLQQLERPEDVLAGNRLGAFGASRREGGLDRAMLALVERIELVDRLVARRPDGRAGERPPRALCHLLDERPLRDAIDHIVEPVIGAHPLRCERAAVTAGLAGT